MPAPLPICVRICAVAHERLFCCAMAMLWPGLPIGSLNRVLVTAKYMCLRHSEVRTNGFDKPALKI